MAEMKKYLDTVALGALVGQIKAEDSKVLAAAKKYTDDAGKLYDVAGAASTAEANAKAYTDELANGQVATNKADIAKLNGDANTEGSVKKAVADAQAAMQEAIDAVDAKAVQNGKDIDALEGKVAEIEAGMYDDSAVRELIKANADAIDALEETHAADKKDLNDAIALKADQTALDDVSAVANAAATQTALQGEIDRAKGEESRIEGLVTAEADRAKGIEGGLRTDVDVIKGDYLKAADKTELQGNIDDVAGDVADIVADYLKAADKTELEGKINAKVAQADYDAKVEEIKGTTDGLQTQINTIMNNPDAEGAINSINEFTQYVAEHGTIADGFRKDIDKNKEDIAAMDTAYKAADTAIVGRLDALEAIDHDAYVDADSALKTEIEGKLTELAIAIENAKTDASNKDAVVLAEAQKATAAVQTALDEAVDALEGADTAINGRLDVLEAKFTGEGSVEDMISDAKQEAIDAAAQDATSKANTAEGNAKTYADGLNTAMNTRVEALEAIDHDHSNKDELDLIASGDKAKWDEAYAKRHEHSNLTVLEGITSAKVTAWDAAEGNAKTFAQGLNDTMQGVVDGIDARVTKNAEDIALKAAQADLEAAISRISKNETDIAANLSAINSFVAITADEVNALFA